MDGMEVLQHQHSAIMLAYNGVDHYNAVQPFQVSSPPRSWRTRVVVLALLSNVLGACSLENCAITKAVARAASRTGDVHLTDAELCWLAWMKVGALDVWVVCNNCYVLLSRSLL